MIKNQIKEVFSLFTEQEDYKNVKENIESGIPFKGTNLWILIFAILIASLGLNVNSTAVIIGAMLISPLMGPIMGVGFSVASSRPELLKLSLKNYAFATGIGLLTSTVYFLISPLSEAHSEILARASPNIYDVLIAFFGGSAGMIAAGSKLKGNVIPGVAIATALMPPLCTAGFGLATGQLSYFYGALYLYIINTVFIAVATILTTKIFNFPLHHFANLAQKKRWNLIMWIVILVTLIPSIWFGYLMVQKNQFEENARKFITSEAILPNNFLLSKKIDFEKNEIKLIYGGQKLSSKDFSTLINKALKYDLKGTEISVKQGFNFLESNANLPRTQINALDTENLSKMIELREGIRNERLTQDVFQEIKQQNPNLVELTINDEKIANDSVASKRILVTAGFRELPSQNQQQELNKFLQIRLKDQNAKVIFEKL